MQFRHTLVVLAALALFVPSLPAIAAPDPYQATVTKIVRQVDWERSRTTVWQPAGVGNLLLVGDTLRTGPDAKAELQYGDGSLTRVGSLSSLTLTGDGNREIHLESGRIWLHVTKHSVGMKVITPGAVAAITGTELMVDFDPSTRLTHVTVFEGSVNVTSDVGNLVRVLGGTTTLVPFREPAAAPEPIPPVQFQERAKIFKPLSLNAGDQTTTQPTNGQSQSGNQQSGGDNSSKGTPSSSSGSEKGQQTNNNQSSSSQSSTKSSDNSTSTKGSDSNSEKGQQSDSSKSSGQSDGNQTATTDNQQTDPTQTDTQPQPTQTDAPQPDTKATDTTTHPDEVKPDLQGQTDTLMDPRVLN
ncbi:MAG TPA: FecR family protein, partial [Oscillatoriaceae cyanobacterium]